MRLARLAAAFVFCGIAVLAYGQRVEEPSAPAAVAVPEAEFHMARLAYDTRRRAGSRGYANPMWAVDYPLAEQHFLPALERYTRITPAPDSRHVTLDDESVFDYPWLFVQQVAAGEWSPTPQHAERLREYLMRGGFIVFDDFHGEREWDYFEYVMRDILPEYRIVEIPSDDPLMNIMFELDPSIPIPGDRHLYSGTEGPPHRRGIYDAQGRLMVAINFNIDMGDAWEHADVPSYPVEMTGQAYRFGTNYVIYAMTH